MIKGLEIFKGFFQDFQDQFDGRLVPVKYKTITNTPSAM